MLLEVMALPALALVAGLWGIYQTDRNFRRHGETIAAAGGLTVEETTNSWSTRPVFKAHAGPLQVRMQAPTGPRSHHRLGMSHEALLQVIAPVPPEFASSPMCSASASSVRRSTPPAKRIASESTGPRTPFGPMAAIALQAAMTPSLRFEKVRVLRALGDERADVRRAARQSIAEIHSRLQGASPGQLSLAGAELGKLSLAETEAGRLSLADDADGQLSIPAESDPPPPA
jgi:hypothetical protein